MAKADEAVQRAAAEAQARKVAADRPAKALSRYIDPKAGTSNPPRLLRYMLEDDPDTRALEKEIGLISRVRRLFQAVDEIVAEEKRKPVNPKQGEEGRDPNLPDRIIMETQLPSTEPRHEGGAGRKPANEDIREPEVLKIAPLSLDDASTEVESTGLDEALSTVQMTAAEIEFLADDTIGSLAGNEPRTVKRFINIYRIIRARLDPEARQAFLGGGNSAAEYPIICVLIAIETGQPPETVSQFYAGLSQTPVNDLGKVKPDAIGAAFQAAAERREGIQVSSQDCLRLSSLVRRCSFNPVR
ncbi:hypothetical protein [Rhizobium azibense]|uniref:Uncharacterized protein n=1 Tax=Rhizobium azibense TaxID=1136135 RepID=A0A4R3RE13_9HYPH|nr:hypothetical protein [Rhizobium azibense]TCU33141.1 hypothetical protein EV129_117138 [Rhizobium azibense]